MAASIKTTGQLREFLANMMVGVKNGDIADDKVRPIYKLAAQVNESFYSETKIAKVQLEAGKQIGEIAKLGELPLNKAE